MESGPLPGCRAVLVKGVEIDVGEELAAVDAGLDGAQAAEDTDLPSKQPSKLPFWLRKVLFLPVPRCKRWG